MVTTDQFLLEKKILIHTKFASGPPGISWRKSYITIVILYIFIISLLKQDNKGTKTQGVLNLKNTRKRKITGENNKKKIEIKKKTIDILFKFLNIKVDFIAWGQKRKVQEKKMLI